MWLFSITSTATTAIQLKDILRTVSHPCQCLLWFWYFCTGFLYLLGLILQLIYEILHFLNTLSPKPLSDFILTYAPSGPLKWTIFYFYWCHTLDNNLWFGVFVAILTDYCGPFKVLKPRHVFKTFFIINLLW